MSVPKIVEIMHTTYQGLSKRRLCKEYVGRKVNNASGFNLRQNFAFACTSSLSPRVITWLELAIQSKTQNLVSSELQNNMQPQLTLDLSSQYGYVILVSGNLVLTTVNCNMDVQHQRCTYCNGVTLIFDGDQTYVRTVM